MCIGVPSADNSRGVSSISMPTTWASRGRRSWRTLQRDCRETSAIPQKAATRKKLQPPPMKPQASLAPLEERDRVYRALLNRLTLAPDHRENLLSRGLTDEAIERLAISLRLLWGSMHWPSPCWTRDIRCLASLDLSGQGWAMDNGCVA